MKQAWQLERELRDAAIPVDRRKQASDWYTSETVFPHGDELIRKFWSSQVPGSFAPEIPYLEMVQAWSNQGYDVSAAEELLPHGIELSRAIGKPEDMDRLRVLTAELLRRLNNAPLIGTHPYYSYTHPMTWDEVRAAMPIAEKGCDSVHEPNAQGDSERIYQGWLGQLSGGAFGTAIEGYTGTRIAEVYGEITDYVAEPEMVNDDVVYELVLLDAVEKFGRAVTAGQIAAEWIRSLRFGWSAEGIAIRNLNMGIYPPESGKFFNYYSDWIGVQMRAMVCGMLAPGQPIEAARLAFTDGIVSHSNNGVYGGIAAAVMTSLAFKLDDPRAVLAETLNYLPAQSEYAAKYRRVLTVLAKHPESEALKLIASYFERYNWIHAYPNMAADLFALWYGEGDFTHSMSLLAKAGNDVDCNAGLVGNVLGVMNGVPEKWAAPIGDILETYLPGRERNSIRELALRTARLSGIL